MGAAVWAAPKLELFHVRGCIEKMGLLQVEGFSSSCSSPIKLFYLFFSRSH